MIIPNNQIRNICCYIGLIEEATFVHDPDTVPQRFGPSPTYNMTRCTPSCCHSHCRRPFKKIVATRAEVLMSVFASGLQQLRTAQYYSRKFMQLFHYSASLYTECCAASHSSSGRTHYLGSRVFRHSSRRNSSYVVTPNSCQYPPSSCLFLLQVWCCVSSDISFLHP